MEMIRTVINPLNGQTDLASPFKPTQFNCDESCDDISVVTEKQNAAYIYIYAQQFALQYGSIKRRPIRSLYNARV